MTPIIEVENLVKRYGRGDVNAVDEVSFAVQPGEFFSLLGPNGAGKTTTISILTTTLSPTSGRALVAGNDVATDPGAVRSRIGIIFQNPSLDLNLTAEENVRFHAVMYGLYPMSPTYRMMPASYRERVDELAQVLGIAEEIFKPVRTFSGGMKRKLEIVRSLIHQPQVLFLDEPTTGLDPASRRNLWQYIKRVREESGTTVFLTTHYLEEAEDADTICVINHGRVVSLGTPRQVKGDLIEDYVLLDADDRSALRAELEALGVESGGGAPFKIEVGESEIHGLLRSINTPLNYVRTHTPTLEEAYLEILARS
jgi:ABC-2 type transport system ATP-binding protein